MGSIGDFATVVLQHVIVDVLLEWLHISARTKHRRIFVDGDMGDKHRHQLEQCQGPPHGPHAYPPQRYLMLRLGWRLAGSGISPSLPSTAQESPSSVV